MALNLNRLSDALSAEITGIDLAGPVDDETFGDLMLWDNRCTIHLACGGIEPPGIRHTHRTTVAVGVPY